jgi:hypothetical protein
MLVNTTHNFKSEYAREVICKTYFETFIYILQHQKSKSFLENAPVTGKSDLKLQPP